MIETVDIDVVAYCREILKRNTQMKEKNIRGRIFFEVEMSEDELNDYYMSDFRKFKRGMDDIKKMLSSKKKSQQYDQ
jgi:hypothetical protein